MEGIEQKSARNYKQWFLIALVVGLALVVISGGIWIYQKAIGSKKTSATSEITPTPTEEMAATTPEVSPVEELTPTPGKKAELKIQILNGGGVKGEAARAAQLLDKTGFKNIKTGNADRFDYEKTEISIKEGQKEFLQEITEALSENYTVSSDAKTLEEKETYDVVIIIGKNKGGD